MCVLCYSGDPERVQRRRPPTAGTQFKASVNALMKNLLSKSPNYIRCVKVSTLGPVHNESSSNKHLVAKIKITDSNVKNFEVPLQQAPAHNEPNISA